MTCYADKDSSNALYRGGHQLILNDSINALYRGGHQLIMIMLTSSTEENDSSVMTMVVQSIYDRRTRLGGGSTLTTGTVGGGSGPRHPAQSQWQSCGESRMPSLKIRLV